LEKMLIYVFGALSALLLQVACVRLLMWALSPPDKRQMILLPISAECQNLEAILRWQLFRLDNDMLNRNALLIVLDCGMSEECREQSAILCKNKKNCCVCDKNELIGILQQHSICKGIEVVLY